MGVAGEETDFVVVLDPAESADDARRQAAVSGLPVASIDRRRVFHLRGSVTDEELDRLVRTVLVDRVGGGWHRRDELPTTPTTVSTIETSLHPGVTDREGAELVTAAERLGLAISAASAGWRFDVTAGDGALTDDHVAELATAVLSNPVIERWSTGHLPPPFTDPAATAAPTQVVELPIDDRAALTDLSRERRLGLSTDEMQAIAHHAAGRSRPMTDAELETLAQTWSEHCSHKTFRALVDTGDGETIDGLLDTYLRAATDRIDAPWVRSAFVDNAGIVAFDDRTDVALKAETHNHPSALEPFGGANTGVGGVVRDILGVSGRPVALTDVLCFGNDDRSRDAHELPDGVLHPRRIRDGVIAGVGDYGNKIGVPTVAGAICHDDRYLTTPLVFAGCIGTLPSGSNPTEPQPGDAIVVLGGAVGRDGVGGATFSSMNMEATTAEVAGSSVQIGDPIVEKGLIDVVVAARDAGLYTAITDCGAGGLSSAVGEMAESLGATVDLDLVPRKYPGLASWEVWLSEAQERMVVACPDPQPLLDLAARWQVGAAVIGHFSGDGRLVVTALEAGRPTTVIDLDTGFLHDGRPRLTLTSGPTGADRPARAPAPATSGDELAPALLALLAHPSVRSNEEVVRTYDHEVGGATVRRPYTAVDGIGPADGTVVIPTGPTGTRGLAVGIGVNPLLGDLDAEAMAWSVVDEAVRNVVCAGGDPRELSLLDNFAWGDPTDPVLLGRLVAACRGCHDAAIAYGAPFVSGKDSLYNQYRLADGTTDPVASTLVITAVAPVADVARIPLVGLDPTGGSIWLVGPVEGALGGSHHDAVHGTDLGGPIPGRDPDAPLRSAALADAIADGRVRSLCDVAEGGIAVAAAQWALGGACGAQLDLDESSAVWFGEGPGRYLVQVADADTAAFTRLVPDARRIGTVRGDEPRLTIGDHPIDLAALDHAWRGHHMAREHAT